MGKTGIKSVRLLHASALSPGYLSLYGKAHASLPRAPSMRSPQVFRVHYLLLFASHHHRCTTVWPSPPDALPRQAGWVDRYIPCDALVFQSNAPGRLPRAASSRGGRRKAALPHVSNPSWQAKDQWYWTCLLAGRRAGVYVQATYTSRMDWHGRELQGKRDVP